MSISQGLTGRTFGGRYRLAERIGSGAMGEVYAATDESGASFAVKVLHEHAIEDPSLVARFQREATIAMRIESPFVARVVEAGRERTGRFWIAFERLFGETVESRLRRDGFMGFDEVVSVIEDVLHGLMAAHEVGVVHRDVRPANVFLEACADGAIPRARLLDFGVGKLRDDVGRESTLTAAGITVGSYVYMSPEQLRSSNLADERADLYAVGALAFRMLSGRPPFQAPNVAGLAALKLHCRAPTLTEVTGEPWPAPIERVLGILLEREASARIQSAAEVLHAWQELREQFATSGAGILERGPLHLTFESWPEGELDRTEVDGP
jgi:serine/threonine-protein kinase